MKKRLLIIGLGGTIASVPTEDGLQPTMSVEEILAHLPMLKEEFDVELVSLYALESSDINCSVWVDIVEVIQDKYDDFDGFVITHGTDTLAYTASAITYMVQNPSKNIVLTGAQKPIGDVVTDGKRNLYDACTFAIKNERSGVYVVFNGKVMFGNHVTKLYSRDFDAFHSVNIPAVASIEDGIIRPYIDLVRREEDTRFYTNLESKVFLLKLFPGIDANDFDFIDDKYRAIVIEIFGLSGLSTSFHDKVRHWRAKGILVFVCSQVLYEGSDMSVYAQGNIASRNFNIYDAKELIPEACFTKVMVAMGQSNQEDEIIDFFYRDIQSDRAMS